MNESELPGGSFRDVAVILERIEAELKQVADGHRLLDEKIDRQNAQLREEMAAGFALVHQALRENAGIIKQLQQDVALLKQDVTGDSEAIHTLTERFDEHLKAHAT